jgi:hypothetical protein
LFEPAAVTPIRPAPLIEAAVTPIMVETRVIETSAIEICAVGSFENGTIVFEVYAIPVVTIPGGIIIIDISGIVGLTDLRVRIIAAVVAAVINGCLLINYRRSYRRRADIDPPTGYAKTHVSIYIHL